MRYILFQICSLIQITADGSIDCQNDPDEQEKFTSPLHTCEIICALQLLAENGNFVVKMFTLLECQSITLIYLVCCLFKKVGIKYGRVLTSFEIYSVYYHYRIMVDFLNNLYKWCVC